MFNQSIFVANFNKVESLTFGYEFNQPVISTLWPAMTYVEFEWEHNDIIYELPELSRTLILEHDFDQDISKIKWPQFL
jgi:hypothetical protein